VGIRISRIKIAYFDIKQAILDLDETKLPIDTLKNIIMILPDKDESDLLKEHESDIPFMGNAEKFLFQMAQIPNAESRLDSWIFKLSYDKNISEIRPSIRHIIHACKQMRESPLFVKILEIILGIGNYMNGGTARGTANGFKLESLSKLQDTKAKDGKTTLLHFVVNFIEKKEPKLLEFETELEDVPHACKVAFPKLQKDLNLIQSGLKKIETQLPNADQRFKDVMSKFLAEAAPEYEKLKKSHDDMQVAFKDTVTFYAEDASKAQSEEFFGLINDFIMKFKKAHKELKDWQEKEKKPTNQPARISHNPNPNSQGLVDELTANLRSGDAFKLRRQQQTASKVPGTPGAAAIGATPSTAPGSSITPADKQIPVTETKQIPASETKEPKLPIGIISPSIPIKPSNMRSATIDSDITSKSEESAPASEGIPNTVPVAHKSPPMGFKLPDPSIKKR